MHVSTFCPLVTEISLLLVRSRELTPGSASAPCDHINGRDLAGLAMENFAIGALYCVNFNRLTL